MLSQIRQNQLLAHLDRVSIATVQQLVELLNSSPATIRRDITELDGMGKLRKIRNGAERIEVVKSHQDDQIQRRLLSNYDYFDFQESERIAEQAVAICKSKESIYVGTGPNTFLMSHYLKGKNIPVYSNAVPFMMQMMMFSYPHLVSLGGQYIESQGILVSPPTDLNFQGRYLFVDGDGLSNSGLSKSAMLAYMEEKRLAEHIDKIVVLISSDKVGLDSGIPVFPLDEIDIVITGKRADAKVVGLLRQLNVEVIIVEA